MPSPASRGPIATLCEAWRADWRLVEEPREQDECLFSRPAVSPSCRPSLRGPTVEEGTILLFLPHVRQRFVPGKTLPVVLFLSLPRRGTPFAFVFVLFFLLVYRILMILIIAIIINIIMISIVTVNVVITGIIMKTCLFFIIAVFIYVIIINAVTVFGFVLLLNQSGSTRTLAFVFLFSFFGNAFVSVSGLFFLSTNLPLVLGRGAVTCRVRRATFPLIRFFSFPLQRIKLFFSSAGR